MLLEIWLEKKWHQLCGLEDKKEESGIQTGQKLDIN